MKNLVRPKVSGFRLARIREGFELFEELESRGELSCSYIKDLLEGIHRSDLAERLGVPSHDSAELSERGSNSHQEGNRLEELPGRCHDADDKTSDEIQENIENARGTEVNEEVSGCKGSSGNSSDSEGDIAAFTDNADFENSSESSSVAEIGNAGFSGESSGSASSSSQSSSSSAVCVQPSTTDTNSSSVTSQDVCDGTVRFTSNSHHSSVKIRKSSSESTFALTSSGQEIQERSVLSITTDEECESGEISGASAAKDENSKEISDYSVGLCNGAVKPSHSNFHFDANDVPDSPVCIPDLAQDSLNLEHVAGVKHDALPDEDVTERRNCSGARIGAHKDTAGDQADSNLSNQSNTEGNLAQCSGQSGGSVMNINYGTESLEFTDNSLIELEQRVEEACATVERVLREREETEEFGREIERKEREIRAERARKKREREAREQQEAGRWPQQQEPITGQSQWLCEHYQKHCRVRFPCCTHFYSCHRCHNNSKACDNEEAKASHATHLKCSYCQYEQEVRVSILF